MITSRDMAGCYNFSKTTRSDNRHARSCENINYCRDDNSLDDGLIIDYIPGAGNHLTRRLSNTSSTGGESTRSEAEHRVK